MIILCFEESIWIRFLSEGYPRSSRAQDDRPNKRTNLLDEVPSRNQGFLHEARRSWSKTHRVRRLALAKRRRNCWRFNENGRLRELDGGIQEEWNQPRAVLLVLGPEKVWHIPSWRLRSWLGQILDLHVEQIPHTRSLLLSKIHREMPTISRSWERPVGFRSWLILFL